MIRVFLVEDHEMYIEGLALLLQKQPDVVIAGTARSGTELLQQLAGTPIDILLLDVHLPDIAEEDLLIRIRKEKPEQKIIYLTLVRGTRYVHKLLRHGIEGYILKNASKEELLNAIRTVQGGGTWFSKDINLLDGHDFRSTVTIEDDKLTASLSRREIEILQLICQEYSNHQIAEKLFLSVSTIETHRKNIIAKLGVNNTVGLVRFALKHKLIE